ncbi:Protein of unknown function DUF91 [Belnapia rosea]|nr:Protein of unknown function DUF91 [Belnapia rosea]
MPRNMQAFLIAQPGEDGSLALHPMKAWLRQHPDHIPPDTPVDTTNSRTIARALIRIGWQPVQTEDEFRLFPPDVPTTSRPEGGVDVEGTAAGDPLAFELEAQLRDFLAHNLHTIRLNGRSLRLYVDQAQREGVEYPTATGPIDILAVDQNGGLVVFELKRAASPDSAIGQLTRYMGWVQASIAQGQPVHGVIVAKLITDRLKYAVQVIPNVSLFEYQIQFDLKPVT